MKKTLLGRGEARGRLNKERFGFTWKSDSSLKLSKVAR